MPRAVSSPLARVRRICLAFPETTERASHGAPSFFIRDKVCFVNYMDNHHDDGRLALWCACPTGMRDGLVKAQPEQYFAGLQRSCAPLVVQQRRMIARISPALPTIFSI